MNINWEDDQKMKDEVEANIQIFWSISSQQNL